MSFLPCPGDTQAQPCLPHPSFFSSAGLMAETQSASAKWEICPLQASRKLPEWASRKGRHWRAPAASCAWCAGRLHSLPCAVWNSQHTAVTRHISTEPPWVAGGGTAMRGLEPPNPGTKCALSRAERLIVFTTEVKQMSCN